VLFIGGRFVCCGTGSGTGLSLVSGTGLAKKKYQPQANSRTTMMIYFTKFLFIALLILMPSSLHDNRCEPHQVAHHEPTFCKNQVKLILGTCQNSVSGTDHITDPERPLAA
jgi:hypothetical protein